MDQFKIVVLKKTPPRAMIIDGTELKICSKANLIVITCPSLNLISADGALVIFPVPPKSTLSVPYSDFIVVQSRKSRKIKMQAL